MSLENWKFSAAEFHEATQDGSCIAGPTEAYFRIWGTRISDGEGVCGVGDTEAAALADCQRNAARNDSRFMDAARELAQELKLPADTADGFAKKIEMHATMHRVMHKHGLFYPH